MPTPTPPDQRHSSTAPSATPVKEKAASKDKLEPTTPDPKPRPDGGPEPKSAPAVAAGPRRRSASKKPEPTLLSDFLRGRPSPARIAANRRRRQSAEAAKASLRHEMKQTAVQKLHPPSRVKDRVQAWQKANAAAMAAGDPDDAATEPTDIAFGDDDQSVTEEDRIRIKMRQKKRPVPKTRPTLTRHDGSPNATLQDDSASVSRINSPPKKRVVSDDNWRKSASAKTSPRNRTSPVEAIARPSEPNVAPSGSRSTISNKESSVSDKVREWSAKVESDRPPPAATTYKPPLAGPGDGIGTRARRAIEALQGQLSARPDSSRRPSARGQAIALDATSKSPGSAADMADNDGQTAQPKPRRSRHERKSSAGETSCQQDAVLDTPTKRPRSTRHASGSAKSTAARSGTASLEPAAEPTSLLGSDESPSPRSIRDQGSDLVSSLANKSLADIPGDIPFGHSAFSELDLPLHGASTTRSRRARTDGNSSLKSVPNVFKKVVEEGKKIIHDINEAPRHVAPKTPPSIEKWLNNTVDPFLDSPKQTTPRQEQKSCSPEMVRCRDGDGNGVGRYNAAGSEKSSPAEKKKSPGQVEEPTVEAKSQNAAEPLKRRRATRSSSSPLKSSVRRSSPGLPKENSPEASGGHLSHHMSHQDHQERSVDSPNDVRDRHPPANYTLPARPIRPSVQCNEQAGLRMVGPRFKPPTNGNHELSTIISEEDSTAAGSDWTMDGVRSVTTQSSTVPTMDSERGKRRHDSAPGLQRRLTRHSDLVSVLSLPDKAESSTSEREPVWQHRRRSHRRSSRLQPTQRTATEDLLQQFSDEEDLYLRELRTMVDGVVPVLLSYVLNTTNATDLFGHGSAGASTDALSRSVVGMGVALEKLKHAHEKAPTFDLRRLAHWAHGVLPIYGKYIGAWQLGFQDLVVNLAPAADRAADELDPPLHGLPRNEGGDLVNDQGERVAVAHLLKRPLVRVKQLAQFSKLVDELIASTDTAQLARDFDDLHQKARRRHKEETARMTDEDAINSSTIGARDLRTLNVVDSVKIDARRQVNAKDIFSLTLYHSGGQRLECRVEVVHRDNQALPGDPGDLLIRELGDEGRPRLLFAPIPMSAVSSRTGDGNFDMVVMVRGVVNGEAWHELLTLSAEDEDQVLDWLDIFPLVPVPPARGGHKPTKGGSENHELIGDDDTSPVCPLNVGQRAGKSALPSTPPAAQNPPYWPGSEGRKAEPSRWQPQTPPPVSPVRSPSSNIQLPETPDTEKTPTKNRSKWWSRNDSGRLSPNENTPIERRRLAVEASPPATLKREEAEAPPLRLNNMARAGPVSLQGCGTTPSLQARAEGQRVTSARRRASSPLKHEYHPSDTSSTAASCSTDESDSGLSDDNNDDDDDIDSMDIPETELGVSIQTFTDSTVKLNCDSAEVEETAGRTSAFPARPEGPQAVREGGMGQYLASISRWSDKGVWKDVSASPCSVVVKAGLVEAYRLDEGKADDAGKPLLALDLTPLVLVRQSTALDLEIRSSVQDHCRLYEAHAGGNFRFRCHNGPDCFGLYMSVHQARLSNQKFIELENEARFRSFGEGARTAGHDDDGGGDGSSSSTRRRRGFFGRRNSYRGSVRAPSRSEDGASTTPSSTPSASSFLRRLTGGGNLSFNIARSSIDRQRSRGSGGINSLYTSGSSSAGGTPPRSPSVSVANGGSRGVGRETDTAQIRLHLLVAGAKWEDHGNCNLQVRRPPPGWRQALRANHGLEKRVTAMTVPKRDAEQPHLALDAVLGSGCFSPMGRRGIVCGIWEEVKDGDGVVGMAPATGATGGNIKKWCFQFATAAEASRILRLVHQEVVRA